MPDWDCRVHRASAETIEAGLRPESAATINRDYASYEETARHFPRGTTFNYVAGLPPG